MRILAATLTLLTLSFVSPAARAEYCNGRFCVGSWVIDSGNDIGQITGFPDSGSARYRVGSSSYDSPLSNLALEAPEIDGLKAGVVAIDEGNDVGTTRRVFEDRRALYTVGSSNYVSRKLVPEVPEKNDIKKETIVIDEGNDVGKAIYAFRDGRVLYRVGSSNYVSAKLSPEVASLGLLKKGAIAIDEGNDVGTVNYVFSNGKASYKVGGSNYVSKKLVAKIESYKGISANTIVMDGGNDIGKAVYVFEDGRVLYRVGSSNYVANNLTYEVGQFNGFKKAMIVIDGGDSVGAILHTFADGRMAYQVGSSVYSSRTLYKEIDAHPVYQKGVNYATSGGCEVGAPVRFFENGKIQLALVNGGGAVAAKLYGSIDSFDNGAYKIGTEALNAYLKSVKVTALFENGSLVYEYTDEESKKPVVQNGKIYGYFHTEQYKGDEKIIALEKADEERFTIRSIAKTIAEQSKLPSWGSYNPCVPVFVAEKLPGIKKALLERLLDEPELISDKDVRKKVRLFLSE